MMIGLDAGFDPGWQAGLQYVRNLVYALSSLPAVERPRIRLLPVTSETIPRVMDLTSEGFVELLPGTSEVVLKMRRLKRRYLQPVIGRPLDRAFRGLDATFPGFGRPIPGVPQIHWIPDFQHVHLPHLFDAREIQRRDARFAELAAREGTIVLSSEAAKRDFTRLYPDAAATARVWRFCSRVTVQEEGGRNPFEAFDLPRFYLYIANQFWVHKDHLTVLKALRLLREQAITPAVVCTGVMEDGRNKSYIETILGFIERHNLSGQVFLLGMLSRQDQIAVMRHSSAVIQPSRFEGWSTVVEDAKALGRPMILSNIDVHLEQAADAVFFQVGSPESLAAALRKFVPCARPGPDVAAEAAAREASEERSRESAREFLSIVRGAIRTRCP